MPINTGRFMLLYPEEHFIQAYNTLEEVIAEIRQQVQEDWEEESPSLEQICNYSDRYMTLLKACHFEEVGEVILVVQAGEYITAEFVEYTDE